MSKFDLNAIIRRVAIESILFSCLLTIEIDKTERLSYAFLYIICTQINLIRHHSFSKFLSNSLPTAQWNIKCHWLCLDIVPYLGAGLVTRRRKGGGFTSYQLTRRGLRSGVTLFPVISTGNPRTQLILYAVITLVEIWSGTLAD